MACLNIDDDFPLLKKIHYVAIGKPFSDVFETRSSCVKIVKELVPDNESELSICRNMKRSMLSKCYKSFDESLHKPNNDNAVAEGEEDESVTNVK